MQSLRVVRTEALIGPTKRQLLLVNLQGDRKQITVEERAIQVPLVALSLRGFYVLADFIEAGEPYGVCVSALVPYLWQGRKSYIRGAVVTAPDGIIGGALLAVPFGFFDRIN